MSGEVEDGETAMSGSDSAPTLASIGKVGTHLRQVAMIILEEEEEGTVALEAAFNNKGNQEMIQKFISDHHCKTLLVERSLTKDEEEGGDNERKGTGAQVSGGAQSDEKVDVLYHMSINVQFSSPRMSSVVFVKKGGTVEAEKSIGSQVRVITLSEGSPYETLHSYVSSAVAPYFKSFVRESGKVDRDGDKMATTMEKKIAELEMGLLHLQQNIDIPEITLTIHPQIAQVIKMAEAEQRKPRVEDLKDKVEDSSFLNALQNQVSKWIREIQKVTKLDRDPSNGTALQEISFWLNLERALLRIQEKRESNEVALTLEVLKHGKRFHATVSFDTDTGLKQAISLVNDYNPLMKDFPINDLLSATELDRIRTSIQVIFTHLRKIRNTKYPIQRALRLVEAISRDLGSQMLKVLNTRRLMHISFEEFEKIMAQCSEVFSTWDDEYDKLQGLMRDIVKRKRDEHLKMVWRVNFAQKKLQARMEHMRKFRRQHEQLRTVIVRVLRPYILHNQDEVSVDVKPESVSIESADSNAIEEVNLAYENVKEVDGLDVSNEGTESWEAAMKRYEDRIDRVETRITSRLRDQLGTAKNANEMFRIFSRFNALFVRPRIRGAIREYQTQLIQRVKDDIEALHTKFKIQYPQSQAYRMSGVRDLPPIAGSIIWAKQIDRQLTAYMRRVEDVLGKGWETHVEGQKLKADGDSFRMKLNTQDIFDDWARKVQARNLGVSGRIFAIDTVRNRSGKGNSLKLRVNFLPEIIQLSKEVRNLKNLGFRVPLAIVNKAHQANQLYPFAISLIESVRTYERSLEKLEQRTNITLLTAGLKKDVQGLISEGVGLVWESYKLDPYVQRLAEMVVLFQEKVDDLLVIDEEIDIDVRSLETCAYAANTFQDILEKIQKAVDSLSLQQYSNLHAWVAKLDEQVETKLAMRLNAGIEEWTKALRGEKENIDDTMDTDTPAQPAHKLGGSPVLDTLPFEIRITNQMMFMYPSVEDCRFLILKQFFAWQAIVTSQARIQSTRYQVGLDRPSIQTFKELLTKLANTQVLENAYHAIEEKVSNVSKYVDEWLRYQSLWDLEPDTLVKKFGEDIEKWMKLLADIKKTRSTFDTSDTTKEFGPIVINFGKVQSKVSLKYDSWHKDALSKFGTMLGNEMMQFHSQISKARVDMEQQTIEAATTSEAVNFITDVQTLKKKMKSWDKQVVSFKDGQRILERQRFQFPSTWLHVDNVEGEWSAFNEIIKRKNSSIQAQVSSLQMKIVAEDKQIEGRSSEYINEWDRSKPVEGHLKPSDALNKINIFESRFVRLKEDRDNVSKAKEALEIEETSSSNVATEKLTVGWEELQDLKGVWSELAKIWEKIDEMKDMPWLSVQTRKLRQQIDGLLIQLKDLPSRLRQYAGYEYVRKLLQGYAKVNVLIVELKSDALKERHWKTICKELRVRWVLSDITLGQVWDVDLLKNEPIIRDVLSVAQGEMALEEFLKQVKETWQFYELDLINYQNKCKLIKGWDELFNKLKENINQVAAMKLSPYYRVFEEEASTWEDKLNRISNLFDVWIDVQRRWVYLEGIFTGNADISNLLPVETSRFNSISTEFLTLMKKVTKSRMVMEILNIQGIQRSLERLADLLTKVQKALGEYLERERASFPRFYFVGDEDLLEIIGNSKNIHRLQKHFKKMFAGVSSIIISEDGTKVLGIASNEGEEVMFVNPVSLTENPRINDWLTEVEKNMKLTLVSHLSQAVAEAKTFEKNSEEQAKFLHWCDKYCVQIVTLSSQIIWTEQVEQCLSSKSPDMSDILNSIETTLALLSDLVLHEQPPIRRKKFEHLIYEYVHRRTITRQLQIKKVDSNKSFEWLANMRFYLDPKQPDLSQLSIHMADAKFLYGFEYLGVQDRLVMTPLTDRCYLTMTQALSANLGGSPFGPAGTGKTETVKALGNQLGRFVLVFNCDETFDFQAMGRIFVGLCQVGAWGCFDEFNRLEERMLSAVSQQIQTIQECLRSQNKKVEGGENLTIELVGKNVRVSQDMAIFITMNPGYAGRSNLPDNLKKLFRSLAMTKPGAILIAEVMLYAQGFRTAEKLSKKIVPLFKLCAEQLSQQRHYDFGLRALKSVLVSAGNVKREKLKKSDSDLDLDESNEQQILVQSVCETMVPKLVAEDIPLLQSLTSDVFPGINYSRNEMDKLRNIIMEVCKERHLVAGIEEEDTGYVWMDKILQLYQITELHHGVMMVGPSGSGKSSAWRVLLQALEQFDNTEGRCHVIDPKALSKEELYGSLDPNTREWKDGLFTHILRKIIDNVRGEIDKRQWIVFDGDVDPEWVENLNSVLDNNKLMTLPNGERLSIPSNVRIMFEVHDLKYATPATVSRCGMVWFSEDILTPEMIMTNYLLKLKNISLDDGDEEMTVDAHGQKVSPSLSVQKEVAAILSPHLTADGLASRCLEHAASLEHIMDFTRLRALGSLFSMLNQSVRNIIQYNHSHMDFPMQSDQIEKYILKCLVQSILWSYTGDSKTKFRQEMEGFLQAACTIPLPDASKNILDFEVTIEGNWSPWSTKVPNMEVETHKVGSPDIVVPTIDTVRHESLLFTWLADHKPMVLCGPPGSGKTMTLFSALRSLPEMEVVGLNFSSATTPELLLKTFDHYCEYRKTPNGIVLAPTQLGKWLVMFCDEINLPDMDSYGTQRIISFLRQLVEHNGFYRTLDHAWVSLERIQFVGACNPPTDPGRKPLAHRFLRHVPVIYVDYPGEASLKQIYCTFNRALLRLITSLRTYAEPLTNAMVDFFLKSQERFTQDMQPHYIYSPREMTRWVRGIYEAIRPLETLTVDGLVRLWAHEALRLFHDRLVTDEERFWTNENIDEVALQHFPSINKDEALKRPILYSNWMTKNYVPVERDELRDYVKARLKVFYEEELDVPLVLFHEVLDHVLRIDRIFHQQQGHLLLIGVSGSGKTTLSRFVAWINGLTVFQIKVHNKYSAEDFDEDLRQVLRRAGCRSEKICFILDESNVMESSFLERMNTLLANGEVPGLFEGDEFTTLMTQCKEGAQKEGHMLDSSDELYKWFTAQVLKNLHIVFTMNPSEHGLKDRAATSPALFNRCVLNWFGDWADSALYQVGKEFTLKMDLERHNWIAPDFPVFTIPNVPPPASHRDAVVSAMVYVHKTLHQVNSRATRRGQRVMAITPRHFLDFINHFVKLYQEKRSGLEEEQLHLNVGLGKIAETVEQVEEMQKSLAVKSTELQTKNEAANAKLKQMVINQQEAEKQKSHSQEIQKLLEKQKVEIAAKRTEVMSDLEKVEPAVMEAQMAVKSIKKQHLVEVRSMANPPTAVRITLESICLLLGENATDWKAIRSVTMKDNFISTIVNFNTDDISYDVREKMKNRYLSNPDYNFEKVNRASMACGPLVKWAIAQLQYSDMLNKVEPLRNELAQLEEASTVKQKEADDMKIVIEKLESSINSYKEEYAQLISQAEAIKTDLKQVQDKVDRSMSLLKSLGIERERWQSTSESFKSQMSTLIGDVFLSSAFLAYAGYFDQHSRQILFSTWKGHLDASSISYRSDFARTEFLSDPDERVNWQANSLPTDDLCTENAIMLKRFNRYPLIIDPSGQATEFIMNEYKDRKITKTSFLDDSFRKNLESALRFGNPLLVQDVENYDPILNPVLNRELRRTGGRVLITLADQDIDLSPSFTIILSTRDPTVEFRPDICSRVTMVNFTVTRSSLQMQCLNQVLKAERPDIDQKRSDLLKLQGEFQLRLRHLEKDLLQCLNEAKGRILDDNTVITTLETLKKEAAEVSNKVDETEEVMVEIEKTSKQYLPLSIACSSIYFTIDNLHQIHFLYQFSLQFFLDIFNNLLTDTKLLNGIKDYTKRLTILTHNLFERSYDRVSRGMLHRDKIVLAVLLTKIFLRGFKTSESFDAEFQFLLTGKDASKGKEVINVDEGMKMLKKKLVAFQDIDKFRGDGGFQQWLESPNPEDEIPCLWEENGQFSDEKKHLFEMISIFALRPDRFIASAKRFVAKVMGNKLVSSSEIDLSAVVEQEMKGNTPVLMCSVSGFDASDRVMDLATQCGKGISSIAIGSAEGFLQAEKSINTSMKSGRWVLLKNVHLAPSWLVTLEKKLHTIQAHPGFRLFLTFEVTPKIPVNLLRAGRIFMYEPPPGIKANLLRTFATIPASRMMKPPNERARLYFMLAWLHAVIQERLRYSPIGWSKMYEFNESDLRVACDMLDTWVDVTSQGRTNLPPSKVPWQAIQVLLSKVIYGGKIDSEYDQQLLDTFVENLFKEKIFDPDYFLIKNSEFELKIPEGIRRDQFLAWIDALAEKQSPAWLGLPNNAETLLLIQQGDSVAVKMLRMQQIDDDDEGPLELEESGKEKHQTDLRPGWMRNLGDSVHNWLKMLPKQLPLLKRTADNIKDPLFRFFEREVRLGSSILSMVRSDLSEILDICQGTKKTTNYHREIGLQLVKGIIPGNWRKFTIPSNMTVTSWIINLGGRLEQLEEIVSAAKSGSSALRTHNCWLGGMFNPEAFITATRQCIAQANFWSLEDLELNLVVSKDDQSSLDNFSFGIKKMKLYGAICEESSIMLNRSVVSDLEQVKLQWSLKEKTDKGRKSITLPVYLNSDRSEILVNVTFSLSDDQNESLFVETGVAFLANS